MGLFDSLFSSSSKSEAKLPDYAKKMGWMLSDQAKVAMDQKPEQAVPGFSTDTRRGMDTLRHWSVNDPYFGQNDTAQSYLTGLFTGEGPASWNEPLVQAQLGDFDRNAEMQAAQRGRDFANRGAFGSRRGLAEFENQRQVGSDRFRLGQQLREDQIQNRMSAATTLDQLAGTARTNRFQDANSILQIGQLQDQLNQQRADIPWERLQAIAAALHGIPHGGKTTATESPVKMIIGAGMAAAGAMPAKDGGLVGSYADGGAVPAAAPSLWDVLSSAYWSRPLGAPWPSSELDSGTRRAEEKSANQTPPSDTAGAPSFPDVLSRAYWERPLGAPWPYTPPELDRGVGRAEAMSANQTMPAAPPGPDPENPQVYDTTDAPANPLPGIWDWINSAAAPGNPVERGVSKVIEAVGGGQDQTGKVLPLAPPPPGWTPPPRPTGGPPTAAAAQPAPAPGPNLVPLYPVPPPEERFTDTDYRPQGAPEGMSPLEAIMWGTGYAGGPTDRRSSQLGAFPRAADPEPPAPAPQPAGGPPTANAATLRLATPAATPPAQAGGWVGSEADTYVRDGLKLLGAGTEYMPAAMAWNWLADTSLGQAMGLPKAPDDSAAESLYERIFGPEPETPAAAPPGAPAGGPPTAAAAEPGVPALTAGVASGIGRRERDAGAFGAPRDLVPLARDASTGLLMARGVDPLAAAAPVPPTGAFPGGPRTGLPKTEDAGMAAVTPQTRAAAATIAPKPNESEDSWLERWLDSPLTMMGAQMMASRNPSAFGAFGEAVAATSAARAKSKQYDREQRRKEKDTDARAAANAGLEDYRKAMAETSRLTAVGNIKKSEENLRLAWKKASDLAAYYQRASRFMTADQKANFEVLKSDIKRLNNEMAMLMASPDEKNELLERINQNLDGLGSTLDVTLPDDTDTTTED
jgi:hypothetical protein